MVEFYRKGNTKSKKMRNLVYAINLSKDGCCDNTKIGGNEEMMDHHEALMRDVDLMVFGRITYEIMVPYWPDAEKDPTSTPVEVKFARIFNAIDKVVFSRSLAGADGNTRIIRTDLRDEVLKLKQQPGKKILAGGVSLPEQLIALGLVDEFYFTICPCIIGEGRRILAHTALREKLNLK